MVLGLLKSTDEEVFSRKDIHERIPNYKPRSLNQYVEALARDGEIGKVRFRRRIYFGNKKLIAEIKAESEEIKKSKVKNEQKK